MKRAIVSGAPGQLAYWMTKLLLEKKYKVIGTYRYSSTPITDRFKGWDHITDENFTLQELDITSAENCSKIIHRYNPTEVYNFAAKSHVAESFNCPESSFDVVAIGVLNLLNAVFRANIYGERCRFWTASSSEMFGSNYSEDELGKYQDENTPFSPNSPYAVAKLAAHHLVRIYRDSYNMYACCGILHNSESEMRGENFVTRKITKWIAEFNRWKDREFYTIGRLNVPQDMIHLGKSTSDDIPEFFPKLRLGNIDATRDWTYAEDTVRGIWLQMQQKDPKEYVFCAGDGHTVREFLQEAFRCIGVTDCYEDFWVVDKKFYRPNEVEFLQGRNALAKDKLKWEPQTKFADLVKIMVEHDIDLLKK